MSDLGNRESIYQPRREGLKFPSMPILDSVEDERRHLKERLVGACSPFALQGFDYGFAGHLTVRDPDRPDLFWTNPMAVHFRQLRMSNLILVDHKGHVVEGNYAVNQAGFVLNGAVHEDHQDIVAMCHANTIYGTAYAVLDRPLLPVTQDACAFFEDHAVISEEGGKVAVEEMAGGKGSQAFKGAKAAIHRNHGLLTASRPSIERAVFWFIALERCCQRQLALDASGHTPTLVPDDKARCSRAHVGSDYIGWLHFQPIWDDLVKTQPDMFE